MTTPAPTGINPRPTLAPGDHEFLLPDGRKLCLYVHHCESCTSVDVFTDRGNEVEEVAENTGDTSRAPMGVMLWRNGNRPAPPELTPVEGSHGWPAVSTITVVWKD